MRAKVKFKVCSYCGKCSELCPEIFKIYSEENRLYDKEDIADAGALQKAREAARLCPEKAIRLEDPPLFSGPFDAFVKIIIKPFFSLFNLLAGEPGEASGAPLFVFSLRHFLAGFIFTFLYVLFIGAARFFRIGPENVLGQFFGITVFLPTLLATLYYFTIGLKLLIQGLNGQSADQELKGILRVLCLGVPIILFFLGMVGSISFLVNYQSGSRQSQALRKEQYGYLLILNRGMKGWNREMSKPSGSSADFHGMDLSGRDFTGYDFGGVNFTGANLKNTRFDKTHLSFAKFENADLSDASFKGAYIMAMGKMFKGANLTNTNFSGAFMDAKDLDGADTSKAIVKGLRKDFKKSPWRGK